MKKEILKPLNIEKMSKIFLAIILLVVIGFASCKKEPTYLINIKCGPNGTVTPLGETESVEGDMINLYLKPDGGFKPTVVVDGIKKDVFNNVYSHIVTKAADIDVFFNEDIHSMVSVGSWVLDSVHIKENDGRWSKYESSYHDIYTFKENGQYTIYRAGSIYGNGPWSFDVNYAKFNLGGGPLSWWDILDLTKSRIYIEKEGIRYIFKK